MNKQEMAAKVCEWLGIEYRNDCYEVPISSQACERGTKCCVRHHAHYDDAVMMHVLRKLTNRGYVFAHNLGPRSRAAFEEHFRKWAMERWASLRDIVRGFWWSYPAYLVHDQEDAWCARFSPPGDYRNPWVQEMWLFWRKAWLVARSGASVRDGGEGGK